MEHSLMFKVKKIGVNPRNGQMSLEGVEFSGDAQELVQALMQAFQMLGPQIPLGTIEQLLAAEREPAATEEKPADEVQAPGRKSSMRVVMTPAEDKASEPPE